MQLIATGRIQGRNKTLLTQIDRQNRQYAIAHAKLMGLTPEQMDVLRNAESRDLDRLLKEVVEK